MKHPGGPGGGFYFWIFDDTLQTAQREMSLIVFRNWSSSEGRWLP